MNIQVTDKKQIINEIKTKKEIKVKNEVYHKINNKVDRINCNKRKFRNERKTKFSLEIFPPKKTSNIDTIYETLEGLQEIQPDFISVTYGAGGTTNNNKTFKIAETIKGKYGIESVVHLTSIGLTKTDVLEKLHYLEVAGIKNILALRGDIPEGYDGSGDFKHASDLINFIHENGNFNIIGACYPEGHIECESKIKDIHNLKNKVDAGAKQLITQLFFNNYDFYSFREKCHLADINVPIEAGIMPVTNTKQINRMATLCGVKVPEKFVKMMDRYGDDPIAIRDAGIAYATDQIVDLIAHGVEGIHLYTMNNPYIANKIYGFVCNLL